MKKYLLSLFVALLSSIVFAQYKYNIVVVLKDGIENQYSESKIKSIRADKGAVKDTITIVLKNGTEEKYISSDIDSIRIEKEAPLPADSTGLLFEYDESSMTASVTGLSNREATEAKIPSQVYYDGKVYDVTKIKNDAFFVCENLTSIEIPESVTSIGSYAFGGCKSLTSIKIPESVTEILGSTFMGCWSLTNIEIPNSVTEIKIWAFYGCKSLTSIEIPESVTKIGEGAFDYCENLTNIIIPNSVTEIESGAFYECTSLTSIEIPNSVTKIGDAAFEGCTSLTSIEIPNSVTKIGSSAFEGCSNLKTARVPGSCGFYDNSFPKDCVIELYGDAIPVEETGFRFEFDDATMTATVTYQENLLETNENYDLTEIKIPYKVSYNGKEYVVTAIGNFAFQYCWEATSIHIPATVTIIGERAFDGCSNLTSIEFPNSVTEIGDFAFIWSTKLSKVEIPNSVTKIGNCAFFHCTSLTYVKILNPETEIDDYAFYECESLERVLLAKGCKLGDNAFPSTCEIEWYYVDGSTPSIKLVAGGVYEAQNDLVNFTFRVKSLEGSYIDQNQVVVLTIDGYEDEFILSDAGMSYLLYENDNFMTVKTSIAQEVSYRVVMCLSSKNSTTDYKITSATLNDKLNKLGARETVFRRVE